MSGPNTESVDDTPLDLRPPRKLSASERWILAGFAALLFTPFLLDVIVDYKPAKLSVPIFLLSWVGLVFIHELGHAVVARMLGWRVCAIVVGFGPTWRVIRIGGMAIEVRRYPVQGFVLSTPRDLRHPGLKLTLIYLAGPAVEILVFLLVLAGLGPSVLFQRSESVAIIAAQSLVLAIGFGVVISLIPFSVRSKNGTVMNDGLGAIRAPFLPMRHFERMLGLPFLIDADRRLARKDVPGALEVCDRGLAEFPNDARIRLRKSQVLVLAGRMDDAAHCLVKVFDLNDLDPVVRAECAIEYGSLLILRGESTDWESAQKIVEASLKEFPNEPSLRVARAGILVERRRFHEAVPVLREALVRQGEPVDRSRAACYLVLAEFRRGNRRSAQEFLSKLLEAGVAGPLVDRVRREVRADA
jgi:hypothetical protein